MEAYTEYLEDKVYDINSADENYKDELVDIVKSFRSFDKSLDVFLQSHGFVGDIENIDNKTDYIKSRFMQTGVDQVPRNLRKFFTEHKRIERVTAFQFCFAFNLDIDGANKFFKKVCLMRGLDCHDIEEAVYYYTIRNGLTYSEARTIIEAAPIIQKGKINYEKDVLYTSSIIQELHKFQSTDELLCYFNNNINQFGYNNATARKYITDIWTEISTNKGLAFSERKALDFPEDDSDENQSTLETLRQILGLYGHYYQDPNKKIGEQYYPISSDRSLKTILKGNRLLHPLAEECFPDRQGISLITRGEHVSHERIRKLLILLVFYKFWVTRAITSKSYCCGDPNMDTDRFHDEINRYLSDARYPLLYAGHPYDWLFMYYSQTPEPLSVFRSFMQELYAIKEDELIISLSPDED